MRLPLHNYTDTTNQVCFVINVPVHTPSMVTFMGGHWVVMSDQYCIWSDIFSFQF